jgi:ankyrin repeat protein
VKAGDARMEQFGALVQAIVSGELDVAKKMLRASPHLAKERAVYRATRRTAGENFYKEILHYMYEGDTALHMAAAAYQEQIAAELIAGGADVRAKNRRGAEPIH